MAPGTRGCAGLEEGLTGSVSVNLILVDKQIPGWEGNVGVQGRPPLGAAVLFPEAPLCGDGEENGDSLVSLLQTACPELCCAGGHHRAAGTAGLCAPQSPMAPRGTAGIQTLRS